MAGDEAAQAAERAAERAMAEIAAAFAERPEVLAVALGGSRATGAADSGSDIDLYVYAEREVPAAFRAALAAGRSPRGARSEIGNRFWELGDEWDDAAAGVHVDVMHRSPAWAEGELARVLDRHEARLGYTTCFWHNILTCRPLFDRTGWFAELQRSAGRPYPEPLARAIVALNRPVLRDISSSYRAQIGSAAARGDRVSMNHRTAAFLASAYDVLFALNRAPHPGEKRLARAAAALPAVPPGFGASVEGVLAARGRAEALAAVDALCDGLNEAARGLA